MQSAFDQFRDTAERTNQGLLEDYFGDKRVLECLQKRGLCNPFTPKAREMASLRLVEKEEQADPLIVDFEVVTELFLIQSICSELSAQQSSVFMLNSYRSACTNG